MCICISGCQTMVTETSKATNFKDLFHLQHIFKMDSNPIIGITFFLLARFFQADEKSLQNSHPCSLFLYNTILYSLTNLAISITFL